MQPGGQPYRGGQPPPQALAACFFCGGPGSPGQSCWKCLIKIPNPAIADVPIRPECPRCRGRMLAIGIDLGGSVIHCCSGCRGLFVPARAWCNLVATPQLAADIERRLPAVAVPAAVLFDLVGCPACPRQMERGRFAAASPIVIDVCDEHGVWLDAGELGQVVHHASHRMMTEAADLDPRARFQGVTPMQMVAPPSENGTSAITWTKRVLGIGALLFLLFRAFLMFGPGGSSRVKNHGQDSARAAEGANTALAR